MSSSGWQVKNGYLTSPLFWRLDVFSHIFIRLTRGQKIEVKCKLEIRFTSTKFFHACNFFLWQIRKHRYVTLNITQRIIKMQFSSAPSTATPRRTVAKGDKMMRNVLWNEARMGFTGYFGCTFVQWEEAETRCPSSSTQCRKVTVHTHRY